MNLPEFIKKIKTKFKPIENDIIFVLIIIFVGLIAFGLGRLSAISERKTPITIENLTSEVITPTLNREVSHEGSPTSIISINSVKKEKLYVASKKGTKYHYPWCSGAKRIKEENKIWFSTKEEAEAAGYSPATNCKGL